MKDIKKIIAVISMLLLSGQLSANTITWSSSTSNVNINDVFTIDIIGTGFLNNVDGGGIDFSYDANVLNVLSVSIDENVWDLGAGINTGSIDNTLGVVGGISVNAWSNVTGDFSVTSITFQAISGGATSLSLSEWALNPWASNGNIINPNFVNATVNVVPVPAAAWLFGSGLIALLGIGSSKRKIAKAT